MRIPVVDLSHCDPSLQHWAKQSLRPAIMAAAPCRGKAAAHTESLPQDVGMTRAFNKW
jgi:hypothetical protein